MAITESITDYLKELVEKEKEHFLPRCTHTIERVTEVELPKPIHYKEESYGHSSKIVYEIEIGNVGKVGVVLDFDEIKSFDSNEYFKRKAKAIRLGAIVSSECETVGLGILEGLYNECLEPRINVDGIRVPRKLGMDVTREVAYRLHEMQKRGELEKYRDRRKAGREIKIGSEFAGLTHSEDFQCTTQHYYLSPDYPASDIFILAARWRIDIYSRINFEEFPQAILSHMYKFFQRGEAPLVLWKGQYVDQANTMSFVSATGRNCRDLGVLILERK